MENKHSTQEQWQEILEWCGFAEVPEFETGTYFWMSPNGKKSSDCPPLDLNNLFKYPVTKLLSLGYGIKLFSDDGYYFAHVNDENDNYDTIGASVVGVLDPVIALLGAIWEAIKYIKGE